MTETPALTGFDAHAVSKIRVFYNEDWYEVIGDESRVSDVNLRYRVTVIDGAQDAECMAPADVE